MNTLLILLLLTNLRLLSASRIGASIRWAGAQGFLLGILVIAAADGGWSLHIAAVGLFTAILKGLVFPWLLFRALRDASIRRDVEPYIGYNLSLLAGLGMLGLSFWIGRRLPLPNPAISPLLVPVAFFSILAGFFLIVSRKKAITQVLGYLVLENGIYAFGMAMAQNAPIFVELGILLDLFVAVFVMGIAIFHIQQSFDHIDTGQMVNLRD